MAKPAVAALREGDVRKALRILHAAPLAPKNEATFTELKRLHPTGGPPAPLPSLKLPRFQWSWLRLLLLLLEPALPPVSLAIVLPFSSNV